jgi:tetrahydromethanopterin S-methyltransferase subunit E
VRNILEKAISKGDNGLKIFDAFDILGNSITGLLFLLIPFILIWIFSDITTAAKICAIAFIPIFLVILIVNRFFDKLKRKAWKKVKAYTLRNQIFKDYNSYFDNEYICSVFKSNK